MQVARPDLLAQVVNVLMVHAGSELQLARGIALAWLDHFVTVTPKDQLMPLLAAYLTSILPSLAEKSLKGTDEFLTKAYRFFSI